MFLGIFIFFGLTSLETDFIGPFEKLFQCKKISSLLEFGSSDEGTDYFLQHCDQVTSIHLHSEQSRQISDAEAFAEATWQNPIFHDAGYLFEIKELCDELFRDKTYDLAFVDPAILIRGDLVNELFGRVDIIAAHDTSFHPAIYGWDWLHTPIEYQKITFPSGSGTTFWIKKTEEELIRCLESQ